VVLVGVSDFSSRKPEKIFDKNSDSPNISDKLLAVILSGFDK
jgi:hypothetical protein